MRMDILHPADQLVHMMNRIYTGGMTTTSGGNLSILEQNGDLWITPAAIDKGALHRTDIVCIKQDGHSDSHRKPSSELHFHQAIYNACSGQVRAILHAHSSALIAFSMMHKIPNLNLIPNARLICQSVGLAPYARMGSAELGQVLADAFCQGHRAVLLENHGVCVGAGSIADAYRIFETLERNARIELMASRLGELNSLSDEQINLARTKANTHLGDLKPRHRTSEELGMRRDMVRLIQRAISQQLFCSSQGTISARLSDGSFLITPYGLDRAHIHEEHLVLVRRGMKEAGKVPSRAVFLHELMYYKKPDIKAIIAAQPPHVMPFTLTDATINPELMPESYVLLGDLPTAPYGLNYEQPQKMADLFTPQTPAVLLENDGIIVSGSSLIEAFDRLEVAEFTGRAQLIVPDHDKLKPLKKEQIEELNIHFK